MRGYPEPGPAESACVCGKVRYLTRADARLAARRMRGRKGRLNAYRCPAGFWHIGHLPKAVIRGEISRAQIRFRPRRRADR